nr:Chain C, AP-2 complex subunit beta [Homo sapiens]5M5R_D Chain D, AP-2 complex subunit beta [Homo sapiens]
CGDLLNLDLG